MQLTLTRLASPNPNPNQVSINPSPGHPPPAEAVQAVTAATAAEPGFAIDAKSGRYAITVKWRPLLGIAPLEVRFRPSTELNRANELGRLVVQLPPGLSSGGGAKKAGDP